MFVDRDEGGKIKGVYGCAQHEGQEELPDDHADIQAYDDRLTNAVPGQVTASQIIRALDESNLLDAVDAAVAQADAMTQRLWSRAPNFSRSDPLLIAIAGALGKTSEELDDIFRLAATK